MQIKIDGTVTINTENNVKPEDAKNTVEETKNTAIVDHSNDVLIGNDATFNELMRVLASRPEAVAASQVEAAKKAAEEIEAKKRQAYGDDYSLIVGKKSKKKETHRPGTAQLREFFPCVASIAIGDKGKCEVYSNGYAVYDNGNRRVVIWVPDCSSVTYYFGKLKKNEKEYMNEQDEISEDELGGYPWHIAIVIAGENRIEFNMDHPKSAGTTSEFDDKEEKIEAAPSWCCGSHFDSPEEAYLKKEAEEERRNAMTEKQREVYDLYYKQGYNRAEIARKLGVSERAVGRMLERACEKIKNF